MGHIAHSDGMTVTKERTKGISAMTTLVNRVKSAVSEVQKISIDVLLEAL